MADLEILVTYRCLHEVLENQGYSNLVLKQVLSSREVSTRPEIGRWAKARITARVYGVVTWTVSIDSILTRFLKKELSDLDGSVRTCLRMGVWELIFAHRGHTYSGPGRVDVMVSLAKEVCPRGAEGLVNAVLRKVLVLSEGLPLTEDLNSVIPDFPEKRLDLRYGIKKEIVGCFVKWYGTEKAKLIMKSFLRVPSVTFRVNTTKVSDREALLKEMKNEDVYASSGKFLSCEIDLFPSDNMSDVIKSACYKDGLISVQSTSAMLVGLICDPKPGWNILDTCSAPGGKTTHLAELMQDQGHIDALDANEVRLKMVDEAAERLGLSIISTLHYDATYLTEEKEMLLPEYDLVLCDVPCSGLGLLHRKPDIRLSMTYEKMQELLPVQESILENSCQRVKKGGYLVYSTCTIDPAENEDRIDAFLSTHPEFECVPFDALLSEKLRENERLLEESKEGKMTILPDEDGMDGFFIAKMRRRT